MKNQNLLDQFFLIDEDVVGKLVNTALVKKRDRVLEIGAGTGTVTREIAKKVSKVLAIEIDESFRGELKKLPKNVEVIFGNALELLEGKLKFNKIIASLPSSAVEPLMWKLIEINFETASFLVPLKFVEKLINNPIFTVYLHTELIGKVEKKSFCPQPKTSWAIVKITKEKDPLKVNDYERFIRKFLFEHPEAKLKNAVMEAIVKIYGSRGKTMTKNQARGIIAKAELPPAMLEKPLPAKKFQTVSKSIFNTLRTENPL